MSASRPASPGRARGGALSDAFALPGVTSRHGLAPPVRGGERGREGGRGRERGREGERELQKSQNPLRLPVCTLNGREMTRGKCDDESRRTDKVSWHPEDPAFCFCVCFAVYLCVGARIILLSFRTVCMNPRRSSRRGLKPVWACDVSPARQ